MSVDETVDFRQDGTLIVNTSHYNNVERVLVENGTNVTLFYPDDDGRNNHKVEEAITELNTFKIGAKSELGETALDMAIKALEFQKKVKETCDYPYVVMETKYCYICSLVRRFDNEQETNTD